MDVSIEENPFWVWTPEHINANDAVRLFVDIFTDFPAMESPSHSFIHGPRGSGKSMMFRMMRPDCARQRQGCALQDLRYLGIYVPIKRTEISQTELSFLDKHPARYVFNEHLLCLYFAIKIFEELASDRLDYSGGQIDSAAVNAWATASVYDRVGRAKTEGPLATGVSGSDVYFKTTLRTMRDALQEQWTYVEQLIRSLPLGTETLSTYRGPLFSYHGFLLPLLAGLRDLSFLPPKAIYLLVDDADNFSRTQTEILNSWISTRTTDIACIKASTQLRYKTRLTLGGQRIEAPHDYQEVDISVLYTTKREYYLNRLALIVGKRLDAVGLPSDPELFFPEDAKQKEEIARLGEDLRRRAEAGEGRGHRPRDDVSRYSRPEFIRQLGGTRKSTHTYSYSGFEQLAHVSSGVVRWFLEPAARMFGEQKARLKGVAPITTIAPNVQNDVIRKFSDEFFSAEFERMKAEARQIESAETAEGKRETEYERLECLINSMGRTFAMLLRDEGRSERRVFSVALSDRVDQDVKRVLDLGVEEGYLYRSTIGRKAGYGRTDLYVLSRRLAPHFGLDPTSFSGYLFVTNDALRKAMLSTSALLRDDASADDNGQMELSIVRHE